MRILVAATASDIYGERLMVALRDAGHEVGFVSDPAYKASMLDRTPNVPVLDYVPVQGRFDFRAILRYGDIVKKFNPDVIFTYTTRALNLMVFARAIAGSKAPLIGHRGALGGLSLLNPLDWLTYFNPQVAAIVCFSRAIEGMFSKKCGNNFLRKFIKFPSYVTIYQGCDFLAGVERDISVSNGPIKLVVIANNRPIKGVDLLLDALLLLPLRLQWRLDVYGKMSESVVKTVNDHVLLHERVFLHGFVENAKSKLMDADIYIQPTRRPGEGFGNAVAEAMGVGLPVISSNAGAAPELVADGKTGILFEADSPSSLAESICKMADIPFMEIKSMGKNAKARIASDFSMEKSMRSYLTLFESLLRK